MDALHESKVGVAVGTYAVPTRPGGSASINQKSKYELEGHRDNHNHHAGPCPTLMQTNIVMYSQITAFVLRALSKHQKIASKKTNK